MTYDSVSQTFTQSQPTQAFHPIHHPRPCALKSSCHLQVITLHLGHTFDSPDVTLAPPRLDFDMSQIKNYTPLSYSYATPASMLGPEQEVDLGQPSRAMFPHSAIPLSPKLSLSQMSPRPSQRPSPLVPSSEALLPSLVSSPPSITLNTHDRLPNRQTSLNINSTPRLLPCQPSTLDALLQPSMLSVETPTFSPPLKQTLPIPTAELPLDVLAASRRWIYTFALINFDLDEGPGEDRMSA